MTQNLENAKYSLRDARKAIFSEMGNPSNTMEQEEVLENMQTKINEIEATINAY